MHHTCSCDKYFDLIFLASIVLETAYIIFEAIRAQELPFFAKYYDYYFSYNFCYLILNLSDRFFNWLGESFSSKAVIVFLSIRWISPLLRRPPPPTHTPISSPPERERERERETDLCLMSFRVVGSNEDAV